MKINFFLTVFSMYSCLLLSQNNKQHDYDIIKERLYNMYLSENIDISKATAYSSKLTLSGGGWEDINYNEKSSGQWSPIEHLNRILILCIYMKKNSVSMQNAKMKEDVNASIIFWLRKRPVSTNWWWNDIGQQNIIMKILILGDDIIGSKNKNNLLSFLISSNEKKSFTGQNLMWFSQQLIVKGAITKNDSLILEAKNRIVNSMKITSGEGIQPDMSFHQHGAQLYSGDYGIAFLNDSLTVALCFTNTKFSFTEDEISQLSKFFAFGIGKMSRFAYIDYNSFGRSISRKNKIVDINKLFGYIIKKFETLDANNNIYQELKYSDKRSTNTYFWTSDFITQQRKDYYTSVRLFSNRIIGTEDENGENEKGFWLPYGNNLIYRTGLEYNNIFAVWDWTKIPGVTSFNRIIPFKRQLKTVNPFAAGCSDGVYGFAAMDVKVESLAAKKAWFMFDNEIVSLGNNISSNEPEEVSTTLNQTLLNGDVIVNGEVNRNPNLQSNLKKNSWIIHNNTGYVFLNPANITLKAGEQSGSWNAINTSYDNAVDHKNVFSLWINHGKRIKNSSYAYIILPNITPESIKKNYQDHLPIEILSNTSAVQAVRNHNLKITQIVFRQPGGLVFDESRHKINVNKPCLVMIRQLTDGKTQITVANSSYSKQDIKVILEENKTSIEQTFHYTGNYDENINKTVIID
ncbi:polysaccharide lyase family 8 super-sandwich domain-containing protein [Daejeonia sp. YH14]|uniref:polysaccharide lyase family 8 super-sandwich domain-containing protein n=1 Tax=Daejeonia sp. YH14 TaxID=3439042 RepID=UPI003F4920CD